MYRFFKCECCDLLIVVSQQNNVNEYVCPACKISKCEHGGKFVEITVEEFHKQINYYQKKMAFCDIYKKECIEEFCSISHIPEKCKYRIEK